MMKNKMATIVSMKDIEKTYHMGEEDQVVLQHVNFEVTENEFVSILGPSGSGKSTMMNIIGCLDVPTHGEYLLTGKNVGEMDEIELAMIRNKEIGFVFQSFYLLNRLTAVENVELPLIYAGISPKKRREKALQMLNRMGLSDKTGHYPNQLSGGQQQRVAIARSVATEPSILLADEPTGMLDQKTGEQVINLFAELHEEGRTVIMITHNERIARAANRIVRILDGRLYEGGMD